MSGPATVVGNPRTTVPEGRTGGRDQPGTQGPNYRRRHPRPVQWVAARTLCLPCRPGFVCERLSQTEALLYRYILNALSAWRRQTSSSSSASSSTGSLSDLGYCQTRTADIVGRPPSAVTMEGRESGRLLGNPPPVCTVYVCMWPVSDHCLQLGLPAGTLAQVCTRYLIPSPPPPLPLPYLLSHLRFFFFFFWLPCLVVIYDSTDALQVSWGSKV